jgi:hypothetical protein
MSAAEQENLREREISRLRKEITAIMPFPVSNNQRARLDEFIHMNLAGVGNGSA